MNNTMFKERLEHIQMETDWQEQVADKILRGDSDNYDGSDGARYVKKLCGYIRELITAIPHD